MADVISNAGLDYDAPPVTEAVLGFEFEAIQELDPWHFVNIHSIWAAKYPRHSVQIPVPPSGFEGGTGFDPITQQRYWFEGELSGLLIQIQSDRLILNWRALDNGTAYPRYSVLRGEFLGLWDDFESYLQRSGLGLPDVRFVEFTYVNHIPSGAPLAQMLKVLRDEPPSLPGAFGPLAIQMKRVIHGDPGVSAAGDLLIMASTDGAKHPSNITLVTRLSAGDPALAVASILDEAHETGRNAFTAITTDFAQDGWGKRS
ncbi:MAG: TIGR04255 family protein [Actinomycetes bacterium]